MTAERMDVAVTAEPEADLMLARLPYGDDERFGFEVLLPTDDTPIAETLDGVGADRWRELSDQATGQDDLRIVLPRFAAAPEHDLVEPLQALGIERAFTPGSDFTPMSPRDPWLGQVAQKAVIEVDESASPSSSATRTPAQACSSA